MGLQAERGVESKGGRDRIEALVADLGKRIEIRLFDKDVVADTVPASNNLVVLPATDKNSEFLADTQTYTSEDREDVLSSERFMTSMFRLEKMYAARAKNSREPGEGEEDEYSYISASDCDEEPVKSSSKTVQAGSVKLVLTRRGHTNHRV